MATTVTVRGYGGAIFDLDVPEGGQERETFDAQVASGFLTILDGSAPQAPAEADEPAADVPDGTIDEIISWVRQDDDEGEPTDGYQDRAAEALEAEQAKGDDARKSLVKHLTNLIGDES